MLMMKRGGNSVSEVTVSLFIVATIAYVTTKILFWTEL